MVLAGLAAGTLLGLAAPFVNASHWSGAIRSNLESWLGRKVEFGAVHFTVFSGPGFTVEDVTIQEDPRYGLEAFAHATALDARLRIDKLLRGQIRFSSLRLVEPSLNLVKRSDGTWNIVELVQRLAAPRRAPLNLFPSFEISGGRVNFKLGTRKSTLYIADSDLSIYPERSGKLYLRFSGSPARTDRAGNGFGHLRGAANWYLAPANSTSNQLEADVTIEPSNLSELTTLFEGYDIGVHGMISSHARIEGPASALRITGELRLVDVHRWDLLPSSGEEWRIGYRGGVDLRAHTLQLETAPSRVGEMSPVEIEMRVSDFLSSPAWTVLTRLNDAPAEDLLALGKRMGLALPQQLAVKGAMNGVVSYSNRAGLAGGVSMKDVVVTAPNLPPLRSAAATATISADCIHVEPAIIDTSSRGTLRAGGDYYFSSQRLVGSVNTDALLLPNINGIGEAWAGAPPVIRLFRSGTVTGRLTYIYEPKLEPLWSGQFQFTNATLNVPALSVPLEQSEGRITFENTNLGLEHFSAVLNGQLLHATYHYNPGMKRPEHLRVDMPSADLNQLEGALDPTLRAQSLLARLRIRRRSIPPWLAERNLDGEFSVGRLSVEGNNIGPLTAHIDWRGANLEFAALQLKLPTGTIRAQGGLDLAAYSPRYHFTGTVSGYPWGGGLLGAEGELKTSGTGLESLRNLEATGTFSGADIQLSNEDAFTAISGNFELSFADGWPNLRLSDIEASDGEDAWGGQAASQSDGKLIVELEHDGQSRRVVSSLTPETPAAAGVSTLTSSRLSR